jgi:putative ABC transport system permease protein
MHHFARELRHAWRSLVHRKVYFIACSGTLALVLSANAAMFAVVNATMLRPLPFSTRGPVVNVFAQPPGTSGVLDRNPMQQMEVPRVRARARTRTLARLEGFYLFERVVTIGGEPVVASGATVTPGLLEMLAAPVAQGRRFTATEGEPGHAVALITHRYWRDTLRSRDVLGEPLILDDQPHTIVGVLAPGFSVPFLDADIFAPLVPSPDFVRAPPRTVVAVAELAPGASIEQARDELLTISGELQRESPRTHAHWTMGVQPFREWQYGAMRDPLLLLMGAGALVLLIACVNIANLTSAHAMARAAELSLRLALGASRVDVLRLHLAELLIVSIAGLVPGLLLARGAVPALLAINPAVARTLGEVTIDWRVQAFSVLVAITAAVVASLVPAMRAMRRHAASVVTPSLRTTTSAAVIRVQRALVSVEVALCVALLMAGAVVIKGLRDLSLRGPGYQAAGVLTAQIRLPEASYQSPQARAAVVDRLLTDLRALPGVTSAGITQNAFVPKFSYQTLIRVKDRPSENDQPHTVQYRRVSRDYFRAMQIKTVAGRDFTDGDTPDRPPVAIVSRRFAETLLPGLDPIGWQLVRNNPPPLTIVGVVDDVSDVTATQQGQATLYVPWSQNNNFGVPVALIIRTGVDPASLIPAVRETLKRVDASLPLRKAQPLDVFIAESTGPERFRVMVLSVIAMLGLLLALVGIGGVTYRSVVDRRTDFAVRLALGSSPGGVIRLVLTEAMRDIGVGVAGGVAAGVAACMVLARSLENIAQPDTETTVAAVLVIVAAGLTAAMLPALKIMRVQPAGVLRR